MNDRIRFAVLGSGSDANAYLFEYGGCLIGVDNGFSCRRFLLRAAEAGFDPHALQCILLTHDHIDHIRGVGRVCDRLGIPVYAPPGARFPADNPVPPEIRAVLPGESFAVGPMEITPFELSHDSAEPTGYSLNCNGIRITLITDTGDISPAMHALALESRILFLEANYDEAMLAAGPYPPFLKRRIKSKTGHLSNAAALEFLNSLSLSPELQAVYLCHLSKNNNSPEVLAGIINTDLGWPLKCVICRRGELVKGEMLIMNR